MNLKAPVEYIPDFIPAPTRGTWFRRLLQELDWVQREDTPRMEYYVNDHPEPYTYGRR